MMNFSVLLNGIIQGKSLSEAEAYDVMCQILSGNLSGEKIAGLLTALRAKGETIEEVVGFVKAMREFAVKINCPRAVVDTCGTGGDGAHTFNISTTAAFIAAGAGVPIAKHGNRSVSSKCGSADVLDALGVNIQMKPEQVKQAVEKVGIGFCFAPLYHQSMKYAAPVRRELGVRTVFNMLGPLLNPFSAKRQIIGVFDPKLTEFFAHILQSLNSEHIYILHGKDGLDEFTLCDETILTELKDGTFSTRIMAPEDLGFQRAKKEDLIGGEKEENAQILKDILTGCDGPKRDISILNAGLAIACSGLVNSLEDGIQRAKESIDSGSANKTLENLVQFSAEVSA
jgi:anthranilate phosphoribosyltransferase